MDVFAFLMVTSDSVSWSQTGAQNASSMTSRSQGNEKGVRSDIVIVYATFVRDWSWSFSLIETTLAVDLDSWTSGPVLLEEASQAFLRTCTAILFSVGFKAFVYMNRQL